MTRQITHTVLTFFVVGLCSCRSTAPTPSASSLGKPMLACFSGYEKLLIDNEFIWQTGAYIDTRFSGDQPIDVGQLPEFSALLIGNAAGRALTAEDHAAIEKWVAAGGTLILADDPGAVAQWMNTTTLPPDHPLLHGLAVPKGSVPSESQHGNGRVIRAGAEFIPSQWPALKGGGPGGLTQDLTPLMQQFWVNLVAYLSIPTRHAVIAEWAKSRPASEAFAVWFSEEEKPTGGRTHVPPHPTNDELKEMRFEMGIGEVAHRDFFVTTRRAIPGLIVEVTDLKGPKGASIPATNIRISIQEGPGTNYWKASYWVIDPNDVEPLGSPAVKVRAHETYTYWMELATGEVVPGDYTGALRFRDGDAVLRSVPVRVKVWPLHAPSPAVLHFELEHIWFCMPGGYWIDPKENNPALLAKYQTNLGKLGVDVGESWSDIDKGYYNKFIRLRADGRPLEQALAESPELFLKDPMPSLSFAGGPHDTWWNNAIQAGMSSFSQSWQLGEASHGMAVQVLKNDKLEVGSPEHLRFIKWYWGEYLKSLRERGLFEAYIKISDEFGPEGIPDYLKSAGPMHEAGFKTYTTTYNAMATKDAVAQLDPATDMWQIGWPVRNPRDLFRENNVPFDANNEIWGTCASSVWGSWYAGGRGYGLLAAWLRIDGIHLHGYMRWQRNEGQGCWHAPSGPGASAGNTIWGQSISDGRYLAQLYRLIAWAKKTGRGVSVAEQIEREINEQVIGLRRPNQPAPLIPLKTEGEFVMGGVKTQYVTWEPGLTAAKCNAAKLRIFEMLLRLQQAMGSPPPNVVYDKIPLVTEGRVACQIVSGSDEKAARALAERIEKLGGAKPPVVSQADGAAGTLVLVGTLQNNPALAAFVQKELATEITPYHPLAGGYAIRRLPATESRPAVLMVAGGDVAGVEIGVQNLGRLLTTENRW